MVPLWANTMFVLLVMVLSLAASGMANHKWRRNPAFDNILPATVGSSASFPAKSLQACAVQCSQKQWCYSFFHNPRSQRCVLHKVIHRQRSTVRYAAGYRYYDTGACPEAAGYIIEWTSKTCLRFVLIRKVWLEARAFCQQNNETLVILEPLVKAKFVYILLYNSVYPRNYGYYIGASRHPNLWNVRVSYSTQLAFFWENGQRVDRRATGKYWNSFDPDGFGRQNVLAIWENNLQWVDAMHDLLRFFICEKPLSRD